MLTANLGSALPSLSSIHQLISSQKGLSEGEFQFNELVSHLKKFNAPYCVNIHLDDTRIIHRVECDLLTDRFVVFCHPINEDGLPLCGTFRLETSV